MNTKDVKSLSDRELLALSVKQPHYFEELVNRYERQFIRKAISILHNSDDAYDAVQETFVRIYTAANRFKRQDGATFSSWAYVILVHQCCTTYRKKQRTHHVSLDVEPELVEVIPDNAGMDALHERYVKDHLMSLISKLPNILRRIVELYYVEGIPQKIIAEQEGISNNVVRARIHRAKKELQKLKTEFEFVSESREK